MTDEDSKSDDSKPEPSTPSPRKKRKKKRKTAPEAKPKRSGVPLFATYFPPDPDLDRVLAAFQRGNYALVRTEATRLASHAESKDVQRAARELLQRIQPDPLAVVLLLASVALLVFLAAWYWLQGHAHS